MATPVIMTLGIRTKLLLIVLIGVLPLALLLGRGAFEERERRRATMVQQRDEIAGLAARRLAESIAVAQATLRAVAALPLDLLFAGPACDSYLSALRRQTPDLWNLLVVDNVGRARCSGIPLATPLRLADQPYVREALTTGSFTLGPMVVTQQLGLAILPAAEPILGDSAEPLGAVVAGIPLATIAGLIETLPLPMRTRLQIVDAEGAVLVDVAAPGTVAMPAAAWFQELDPRAPRQILSVAGQRASLVSVEGLWVAVAVPEAVIASAGAAVLRAELTVIAGSIVLAVALAWLFAHGSVIRRMHALARLADRLRRGDLAARITIALAADELDQVGAAMNAMAEDIGRWHTQAIEREASYKELATRDPLTGLANRRVLEDELRLLLGAEPEDRSPFALLSIDLDHFKAVNDAHGHETGDALLQVVARRLVGAARSGDLVARLAGDEFMVVLRRIEEGRATAGLIAERIVREMAHPIELGGLVLEPGASVGVALFPDDGSDLRDLLRAADRALYAAKRRGGGTWLEGSRLPSTAEPGPGLRLVAADR